METSAHEGVQLGRTGWDHVAVGQFIVAGPLLAMYYAARHKRCSGEARAERTLRWSGDSALDARRSLV